MHLCSLTRAPHPGSCTGMGAPPRIFTRGDTYISQHVQKVRPPPVGCDVRGAARTIESLTAVLLPPPPLQEPDATIAPLFGALRLDHALGLELIQPLPQLVRGEVVLGAGRLPHEEDFPAA